MQYRSFFIVGLLGLAGHCLAETISNDTLVANQQVAKAQAVGAITTFMSKGAQVCDDKGQNCHSVFGSDDSMDYGAMQKTGEGVLGVQAFNYPDSNGETSSVAVQLSTVAIVCGDYDTKIKSGVAIRLDNCKVNSNGDAKITYRTCTAPSRSLPVTPPANAVECSTDPTSANYRPPAGKVCQKATCDTEPVDSLNGWSSPQTLTWVATMPAEASAAEQSNNGLGMTFYPPLSGGALANYKTDSDNLTIVKIVATMKSEESNQTAVGLRVAYRRKTAISRDQMEGTAPVVNPQDHTDQWNTIIKLQGDPRIAQYGAQYAKNGAECIDQVTKGLSKDGKIYVCDQTYDQNGIKPLAKYAQVAGDGEDCGTTTQCLQKVVNTNTWKETCRADVPLAVQECVTETAYTMETNVCKRERETDICHEKRTNVTYSCSTQVDSTQVVAVPRCPAGTWVDRNQANAEFGAPGADRTLARYYCDLTQGDNGGPLALQVYAHGGQGACVGWQTVNVDFSYGHTMEAAAALAPHWNSYCNFDVRVDVTVTKTCSPTDTTCGASLWFYHQQLQWAGERETQCTYDVGYSSTCTLKPCPAGTIEGVNPFDSSQSGCLAVKKYGIQTIPMTFLRPGIQYTYPAAQDTCAQYEALK